jgi:large subunit ribosomal protein L3
MIDCIVGKKCGMTRVFTESGNSLPVTIIEVNPNRIVQIKTNEYDGYSAIQVTTCNKKVNKLTKPMQGHFAKAKTEAGIGLWELCASPEDIAKYQVGNELTLDLFSEGAFVDVTGVTKGKGFEGVIKRHHFTMQDATHGNSLSHRAPGSIGQRQTPGRVFKGKKMAGHLGSARRTIQNQEIVKIDKERNLVFVKGVVPGAPNGVVFMKLAIKKRNKG